MSQGGTPVSISANAENDSVSGRELYEFVRQGRSFSGHERHCSFLNMRQGKFADISAASGWDFPDDGRAISRVDWDLDGDLDFWIANRNGPQLRFLRNDVPNDHHYVGLQLVGRTCNRDAIGARVELVAVKRGQVTPVTSPQIRTVRAGDGFLAQSTKWIHFGMGEQDVIQRLVVKWPGGVSEEFREARADQCYVLVQGSGSAVPFDRPISPGPLSPSTLSEPATFDRSRVISASMLPVPPLQFQTFDGELDDVASRSPTAKPKPILLNLWASWCQPCRKELTTWGQRSNELQQGGIDVVALSVDGLDDADSTGPLAAQKFVTTQRLPFRVGLAGPATVEKLQLLHNHLFDNHRPLPVPTSFLIDSAGQLAAMYRGPVDVDQVLADVARISLDAETRVKQSTPFPGRWHFHRRQLSPLDLVWKLTEKGYLDDAVEYVQEHRQRLDDHYNFHKLLVLIGNGHLARGGTHEALRMYREALAIDEDYSDAQNNLAWLLATHPDDTLRDGKEAVRLAELADGQQANTPSLLDTLAAAYAEDGQYDRAVATAERALTLARQQDLTDFAKGLAARLAIYRQGQPHRDP